MTTRRGALVLAVITVASIGAPTLGSARGIVSRSSNLRQLTTVEALDASTDSSVWELAFQDDLLIASADGNDPDSARSEEGLVFFRILERAPYLKRISTYRCRGNYGDLAIWRNFAFIPVPAQPAYEDTVVFEAANDQRSSVCNNTHGSRGKAGVRIVDFSEPRRPRQVGFVPIKCGAARVTLNPTRDGVVIYGAFDCFEEGANVLAGGYGGMNVICFDDQHPSEASVCSKADVTGMLGCLDVAVHVRRQLGACVDINQFGLLGLSDAHNPRVMEPVSSPGYLFSASFTWDGQYLVVTDSGVNTGGEPCVGRTDSPASEIAIYNVEDVTAPVRVGGWSAPLTADAPCYPSTVGMIPTRSGSYLATIAYARAGLRVIDFTQPAEPKEVAHFVWRDSPVYGAYWYNGRIYATRGGTSSMADDEPQDSVISVLELDGTDRTQTHFFRNMFNPQTLLEDFR